MIFTGTLWILLFLPDPSQNNFYSLKAMSTAYLLRGVEEAILNPAYLFVLGKSHLITNLSDYTKRSLYVGGNINSDLLREGALFYIRNVETPLVNSLGDRGLTRRDITDYPDTNGDNLPDLIRYSEFQTDGYRKDFDIDFAAGFQFVGDQWFLFAGFLKAQQKSEVESPGDTLNALGYFEYKEGILSYPDSGFVRFVKASGDKIEETFSNKTGGQIGGGFLLGDTSYISLSLSYYAVESNKGVGGYFSFERIPDTLSRQYHQERRDFSEIYNGHDFCISLEYLDKNPALERLASFRYTRGSLNPDTIWDSSQEYFGIFSKTTDTLFSSRESLGISQQLKIPNKTVSYDRLEGGYSQIFYVNSFTRFAFGVRGKYYYQFSSFNTIELDSIDVSFNDGDTISNEADDFERYIFVRYNGSESTEIKEYVFEFPVGFEIMPFGLKSILLLGGTVFRFSQRMENLDKSKIPQGEYTELTVFGDSTRTSNSRPVGAVREKRSWLSQSVSVDYTLGMSLELSRNIQLDMCTRLSPEKISDFKMGFVFKF
ncbi:MAG: hypothetical protein ACPLN0_02590 [Candidatus Hydrothermia bacterium]